MASVIKLGVVCMVVSTTAYLAVSPRTMPIEEYNQAYKTNLFRVGSTFAWPLLLITGVFRHTDADVNQVVHTFFMGFAIYFPLLCLVEKTAATAVRLAILKLLDGAAFKLCPRVPAIHLPWVLREHKYFPRRCTMFLFLFCNHCITAPLIEEIGKSWLLRRVLARCQRSTQHPAVSVRSVLIYMLALTLGVKMGDTTRRVLLYSAPVLKHKDFFAIARSIYPVQEICSMLTALNVAKELSAPSNATATSRRRWPLRSIFLHSMATMRGMKPMFVWDASRPWDEVQLQSWNAADNRTPVQLFVAGILNFAWFVALYKYLQVAIKKYFRLSRAYYTRKHDEAFASLVLQRRMEMEAMEGGEEAPVPKPPLPP